MPQAETTTPPFRVAVGQQGRWTVVQVLGELTYQSCPELTRILDEVCAAAEHPRITVDTSGLEFFDSSAIRCLIVAGRETRRRGGEFVVVNAGALKRRMEFWGVLDVLPVVATMPAGSEAIGQLLPEP